MEADSDKDSRFGAAQPSDSAGGTEQQGSQHDEGEGRPYIRAIPAPDDQLTDLQQQLPLRLKIFEGRCAEVPLNQKTITVNGKSRICQGKEDLIIYLASAGHNNVNLKISAFRYIGFKNCRNIRYLDISHTFICHLDIRRLMDLEDLRLTNTNIKRLDLMNQRGLRTLYCNYTLIEYIEFSGQPLLEEIHIECLGQLKSSRIATDSEVFIDGNQILDNYLLNTLQNDRMECCVVAYPQVASNQEEFKIILPKECNELADRNIRQCRKLAVDSINQDKKSAIVSFDVIGYHNLQELNIQYIKCYDFYVANLPSLTSIRIYESVIPNILIASFPDLREIKITYCEHLEQLVIVDCEKVETVVATVTKISYLDVRKLKKLQKLDVSRTNLTQIDVCHNAKLKELYVNNTKISQINVSRNIKLEYLYVGITNLSQLDVSQLTQLKKLKFQKTKIIKMDLSNNIHLTETYVSGSQLVTNCCCKLSVRD